MGYFYFSQKQMDIWGIKECTKTANNLEEEWEGHRSQGQ